MANSIIFYIDGIPIENVSEFKYLGRILSADDRDDAAVSYNIKKASQAWFGMYHILLHKTSNPCTMAHFYLAIVQAKLLYGSESWVLSKCLLTRLERFHAKCARILAHHTIHHLPDGTWEYPPTDEVLDQCGLSPIATYIAKCKATLLQNYVKPFSTLYQTCITSTHVGTNCGGHRSNTA